MNPSPPLSGKSALVTGASRGLGKAVALGYARAGADLALIARTAAELDETARAARDLGVRVVARAGDVSHEPDVAVLVAAALDELGRIDVLFNNAGLGVRDAPLDGIAVEEFDYVLAVNLRGPFLAAHAVLPAKRRQAHGRIINVTSGLSVHHLAGYNAYNVSKAGLNALTRTLANDLAGTGVLVNGLDPGAFRSGMNHSATAAADEVLPDALRLATLPADGPTGRFFYRGADVGW
jgi:NAD(P)-dependent dehydrogenase (short-subunit alcohol dehydrogenase family)